jgi:hypothetical protein
MHGWILMFKLELNSLENWIIYKHQEYHNWNVREQKEEKKIKIKKSKSKKSRKKSRKRFKMFYSE